MLALHKVKHGVTDNLRIPHKYMYPNVHSSIIHNRPQTEKTISIKGSTDFKNVVYPYNGILSGHKQWGVDTCYNIDEPWQAG